MQKKHFALETYDIAGVEIFSAGTWNGDEYTLDDLNSMVSNFDELRSGLKPYLKLGHDEEQDLIQTDGLPAAGWIERLYVMGDKLVADFSQIPKTVYELIKSGGYKKVSSEIFWNLKIGEKVYSKVLAAVALLGADTPAVMNLKDILAMYNLERKDLKVYKLESFKITKEGVTMTQTEKEIQLEGELEKAKEIQKTFEAEKMQYSKELEELKSYKAKAEEEKQKLLEAAQEAKREKFVTELISAKLISEGMKENISVLWSEENEQHLKSILTLSKELATVNLGESSVDDKGQSQNDEAAFEKQVQEYMSANKGVTYTNAIKAVRQLNKK